MMVGSLSMLGSFCTMVSCMAFFAGELFPSGMMVGSFHLA